ncbi:AAA family ATPase [Thalassomonas viridans]|uniref:AAA family ATPase n=1 Tax=Thalassomonas viridans TaxID=137584 RepID=A0AAE9Z800_9GAMM|nr:AAA family ATPase [Thalassomonas viridans]WDE07745.1 AAA family ATPase [Thalassomonas viridans]
MQNLISAVVEQVGSIVLGKPREIRLALACLLAQGHILIEDLPGMGKTTLAQVLAKTLGLSYQRTQFTSDLLPADVTGISIYHNETKQFELHKGPIFNQVVLADEINRANPKTQSALLEAMAEHQVSIDGTTYELPSPFFVIATQNPLSHAGTYPLPESQLDRFMMRISLGFPDVVAEKLILLSEDRDRQFMHLRPCLEPGQLLAIQKKIDKLAASDAVLDYIIALCHVSRGQDENFRPLSPRAGKALLKAAKAWAFMENRDFVHPEDVQAVFAAVCQHRLEIVSDAFSGHKEGLALRVLEQVDPTDPLVNLS